MNEIEEIKKKRLEEFKRLRQSSIQQQIQEENQFQQQINQLEEFVKQFFTKEALLRYGNLKTAHPEKAVQLIALLAQAIQSRQIGQIDDKSLKELLRRLSVEKKEFRIIKV